jgi:FkbM family methyltransferase
MKHVVFLIIIRLIEVALRFLRLNTPGRIKSELLSRIQPVAKVSRNGQDYWIDCPNALTRWRAQTFFTKEPDTLAWIESFAPGDVLFDIGANIGLYSVYAGRLGHQVLAFEPEAQNLGLLNRNIHLNGLSEWVKAYGVGLTDSYAKDNLQLSVLQAGGALHNVGEAVDWRQVAFTPVHEQGVITYSLDRFLSDFPDAFPQHIKIDVDGAESRIVSGAEKTFADPRLRSVLIELNIAIGIDAAVVTTLENHGFTLTGKANSPLAAGDHMTALNHIFTRA